MPQEDDIRSYVEDTTLILESMGLPRTAGRVLAYLIVCDPPEQTMHDLVKALGLSKSSVSTALKTLIGFGMVDRISKAGIRRDFYRVEDGLWTRLMAVKLGSFGALRDVAQRGLDILQDEPARRTARLRDMFDLFDFLDAEMPALLARWEAHRRKQEE